MKKPTKSIITSSLLAVAFGALSVGSTFALFTSQSKTEISVESGIVNVESKATLVNYSSTVDGTDHDFEGTETSYINPLVGNSFSINGDNSIVTIDKMVPGDVLTLKLSALNKSNVKTKTRLTVEHSKVGTQKDLFPALDFTFNAGTLNATDLFRWQDNVAVEEANMAAGVALYGDDGILVTIAFPDGDNGEILFGSENHDNQYQDAACSIAFSLQAVQGNAATSPIDEINTYLSAEMLFEGQNKTMHDAVVDMAEIEYTDLDVLDGYVYDLANDQFVKENTVTANKVNYFRVYESMPTTQEFSIYAAGSNWTSAINNLTVGFDAGDLNSIVSIEYNRHDASVGQEVTIRTNGGTLTVDAPLDTIHHYGDAQMVSLTAVSNNSYYENGSVSLVDVKKGRLVITNEEEASVGTIYLSATNDAYDNIILATQSEAELPTIVARESVTLPTSEKKLVVTIQQVDQNGTADPTQTEEIYLYPESDVKEEEKGYDVSDLGLLVVEALSTEGQAQAEEQLADKGSEVIDAVKETNVENKEKVVADATVFLGGKGTKDKPYLISNRQQLENISKVNENYVSKYDYACDLYYGDINTLENESLSSNWSACVDYVYGDNNNYEKAAKANNWSTEVTGGYFKVADGVKEIDCSDWTSGILYGHFDGNGVILNNLNAALFNTVYDFESNIVPFEVSTISNLTANVNIRSTSRYFEGFITNLGWSTSFKNVVLHGYIEAQNAASFVGLGIGYSGSGAGDAIVISFDNCYSDISLVSVGGFSSGFVAHPYWGQGSKMVINDSIYYGRATSTNGNHYYKGNSINDSTTSLEETYTDGFFSKFGYTSIEDLRGTSKTLSANYAVSNKSATLTVKNDLAKPELGSVFTVNQADGAVKAVAKFIVGPNDVNEKGNYTGVFLIDEDLTASNGQFITENVKYYTVTVNGDSTEETGVSGTNFNIVRGSYGTTYTTYMVEIVQYDADGNIICINRCDLR